MTDDIKVFKYRLSERADLTRMAEWMNDMLMLQCNVTADQLASVSEVAAATTAKKAGGGKKSGKKGNKRK